LDQWDGSGGLAGGQVKTAEAKKLHPDRRENEKDKRIMSGKNRKKTQNFEGVKFSARVLRRNGRTSKYELTLKNRPRPRAYSNRRDALAAIEHRERGGQIRRRISVRTVRNCAKSIKWAR